MFHTRLSKFVVLLFLILYLIIIQYFTPHPIIRRETNWGLRVSDYQYSVYSQGGQDGSLAYIFENIGTTNKKYVEFGFNADDLKGSEIMGQPNTRLLRQKGWSGLLLDGGHENPRFNLQKLWIEAETIVEELRKRGVENGTDYISVDIDSADCFVMERIACELQPRVMSIEYNSNYPLEATIANIGGDYLWDGDRLYGCSLGAQALIAQHCGYTIVDVVTRLDVIIVRNDLLTLTRTHPVERWRSSAGRPFHHARHEEKQDKYLCDYSLYLHDHNLTKCMGTPVREQLNKLNYNMSDYWYISYVPIIPW
jgi:hypothetical protein